MKERETMKGESNFRGSRTLRALSSAQMSKVEAGGIIGQIINGLVEYIALFAIEVGEFWLHDRPDHVHPH